MRPATIAALLIVSGGVLGLAAITTLNGRGPLDGIAVGVEFSDATPEAGVGELDIAAIVRNDTDTTVHGAVTLAVFGPTGELALAEAAEGGLEAGASITLTVRVDLGAFDPGDELEVHVSVPEPEGGVETRILVRELG